MKVDFYEVEVRYTGEIEELTNSELLDLALIRQAERLDFTPDHSEDLTEDEARKLDGKVELGRVYPDNKVAYVKYSYIREEEV